MKFLLVAKQNGEGCDYTIGCGKQFKFIEAPNEQEAIRQVIEIEDECSPHVYGKRTDEFTEIYLVRCDHVIDILPILEKAQAEFDNKIEDKERAETEAEERAQLEKLQKKYGKA